MSTKQKNGWLLPGFLLVYGALNVLFGALQLDTIFQGPPATPDEFTSMHYFEMPIPIVLHIVAGIFLNLVSPFQFALATWRRWPALHRWSGRLVIVSGFLVGLTGLWMNQFYPLFGGLLKYTGVMAHSIGLMAALGIALWAILGRDVPRHRVWMTRAIAIGLGPATQRLFILPVFFIFGSVSELAVGLVVWWGILLNLAVVEWFGRRSRSGQMKTALKGV
ncbi:MAG: DUF2306 domain-containing protein [Ardenticatenaceae bacterium]|nr:DUF2306 domain-containing protein [Ardenticatenaceae bacterium]